MAGGAPPLPERTMKSLLILGAGGFGHMIQETALMLGYEKTAFLDDFSRRRSKGNRCHRKML